MSQKILIQHFDEKCHPLVTGDISEDFLPLHSEVFVVALGHHLEASLDEGFPENRVVHLHVQDCSEESLAPAILCHKEPARAS